VEKRLWVATFMIVYRYAGSKKGVTCNGREKEGGKGTSLCLEGRRTKERMGKKNGGSSKYLKKKGKMRRRG